MNVKISAVKTARGTTDYAAFGEGKTPFVILPGISLAPVTPAGEAIAAQYEKAEKRYTVYLFDRKRELKRGDTVEDMAEDAASAMEALGLSGAVVFGASQGGMMAECLAADHPALVSKLVLCSTTATCTEALAKTMREAIAYADKGDAEGLARFFYSILFTDGFLSANAGALDAAILAARKEDLPRFRILAEACFAFSGQKTCEKIVCPSLVLGAENDGVMGKGSSEDLARRLDAEVYIYPGYRHAAYDEAPDYLDRVFAFCDKWKE